MSEKNEAIPFYFAESSTTIEPANLKSFAYSKVELLSGNINLRIKKVNNILV